ncbi:putative RpiR familytranscriptional regulator with phosphosugar-binding domain [Frankia canadensis]|uniref:Putative RpiR familytranscriptional regulator with phosphosugar-binding domain n=1 Tax=Frankia canadensis TaxID=1836972 RepID=A0A2I2KQG0_9ACTN|nr:MurR/RpiR family transcriptional regulator [Frankia canadensis]SNQ47905.1 putative RpiR familytranscriptional regulator with phosphosugar-binding domain [Frankia canadensis]SOU55195.1 putative RpiR familytranscriptional regulator with phosphosugar-binding domain [Frankia canadensis]
MATPTTQPSTAASAGGARPGGLFAAIRATLPSLVPSERRVAEVCLARPEEIVEWSAAQLADAAGTSTATVVRACQSLGFRGFQHLRLDLAREAGAAALRGEVGSTGSGDPVERLLDTVFAAATKVLADALGPLDRSLLAPAVDLLDRAGRLLVVGNGGSGPIAQDAALRFLLIGRPAEAPSDSLLQSISARLLAPTDVCLVITSSGANEPTLRAAEAARTAGAPVIGITSYTSGPLGEIADILLVVGTPDWPVGTDLIASRLASLLLLNTLQLAVGLRRGSDPRPESTAVTDLLGYALRAEPTAAPDRPSPGGDDTEPDE